MAARLDPGRQALMALAHLRNEDQRLAAGLGVGVSTVYRYLREPIDLLAAQAILVSVAQHEPFTHSGRLLIWLFGGLASVRPAGG